MPLPLQIALIALGVLLVLFGIYMLLIAPSLSKERRARMRKFTEARYAHRGLHDGTRAENSMSAFKAAVDAGYGIELDVRLSSDGELVVFHDNTLDRMTESKGRERTLSALVFFVLFTYKNRDFL